MSLLQLDLPEATAQALDDLQGWVQQRAKETDELSAAGGPDQPCVAPQQIIAKAGELGLLALDAHADRSDIAQSASLISTISGDCVTSAFSLWAHRMVLEYLHHAPAQANELQELRAALTRGEVVGVTAFAAALQASAGVGSLTVQARRTAEGLVLDGKVMWASNLVPNARILVPVRVVDEQGETVGQSVVVVPADAAGLQIRFMPNLMALSNTASGMLTLENVVVGKEWIVSEDLQGFLAQTRPVLLLLQTSLALGLAQRCLAEAAELLPQRGNVTAGRVAELQSEAAATAQKLAEAVRDPWQVGYRDLIELRLGVVHLTLAAAQAEHTLRGGAGYVRASATNRRLREALFLPVQSPSEVQLLQELQRLDQE